MRFLCTRNHCMVKARQLMHICQCSGYHARGVCHIAMNKINSSSTSHSFKDMSYIHKRSTLHHTPSMGFIGHGFNSTKHFDRHSLIEIEDHTLSFAETFSSTTGSIIEGDEGLEELEINERSGDSSILINNFKLSVDGTVELFKGTSATLAIDGQINKVCNEYKGLSTKDSKMHALAYISSNLGTNSEKIRQKAEDLTGCQLESPRFHKLEQELREELSPTYNELFRRMGQRKDGVKFLVDLRADLIESIKTVNDVEIIREEKERLIPMLKTMNNHLKILLAHWFSVGFLTLEHITWSSSCSMLQKVSDYEAVHPLRNWTDLKARVGAYRRCFVYTHLSMPGEPIVVLHVALTKEISSTISSIIKHHRRVKRHATIDGGSLETIPSQKQALQEMEEDPSLCTTAIFYTITSTQTGLQGIELGTHLIKHAVKSLKEEFPEMNTFSTLSPIPSFRAWLLAKIQSCKRSEGKHILKPAEEETLKSILEDAATNHLIQFMGEESDIFSRLHYVISSNKWVENEVLSNALETPLMRLCAQYLYLEKRRNLAFDPVANFHLRNGASVWRINWLGDLSPRGLTNSCGLMVNYRYFIDNLEENSASYQEAFNISAGEQVLQLASQAKCLM